MEIVPLAGVAYYTALGTFSAAIWGLHGKIQVVLAEDIGVIAAMVVAEMEVFIGQIIDIVRDGVSVADMQKVLRRSPATPRWLIMMMVPRV